MKPKKVFLVQIFGESTLYFEQSNYKKRKKRKLVVRAVFWEYLFRWCKRRRQWKPLLFSSSSLMIAVLPWHMYLQNPFWKDAWQSCFLMAFETFLKAFPSMSHSSTQHDIDSLQLLSLYDKNYSIKIRIRKAKKWAKILSKSIFRNCRLKSHKGYLICRTCFDL